MTYTKKLMRFDKPSMVKGFHDFCLAIGEKTKGHPLHIVELGSYAGESAMMFLSILNVASLNCVDTWAGSKYHPDDIQNAEKRFDELLGSNPRVFKFKASSDDPIFSSVKDVDLVYIDADHSYEAVKRDILFWSPKCKIISGHDYDNSGKYGVKKAVDELFGKPDAIFEDGSWFVGPFHNIITS